MVFMLPLQSTLTSGMTAAGISELLKRRFEKQITPHRMRKENVLLEITHSPK